jgi:hypothetical protein
MNNYERLDLYKRKMDYYKKKLDGGGGIMTPEEQAQLSPRARRLEREREKVRIGLGRIKRKRESELERERLERLERLERQVLEEKIDRSELGKFINDQPTGIIHDDIKILERIKFLVHHLDVSNEADLRQLSIKSRTIFYKYNRHVTGELMKYIEELWKNIDDTINERIGTK